MRKILYRTFNIGMTILGGQAFNWVKDGDFYYGVFSDGVLKIRYGNNCLYWESSKGDEDENFVRELFEIELDYESVLDKITKDEAVKKAVELYSGLRILKQPFEQTLISFVISQNSNIPKIRGSLNKLSKLVGRKILFDSKEFYLFPTIEEISRLSYEELISTGIGYRARYIQNICKTWVGRGMSRSFDSPSGLAQDDTEC